MKAKNWKEKHDTIKACKRYIDAHIREDLDLRSLAVRCSCSYSGFRKIFAEVADYTPHKYIRLRRTQLAAQYMRQGFSVTEAAERVGFETLAGFYKAFTDVYGVTPQDFAAVCGKQMMKEPELREIEEFFLVGYVLEEVEDMRPEERWAYWIMRECPELGWEDYSRIGGGADMAALWVNGPEGGHYVIGPPVKTIQFVPEIMEVQKVPGGSFLEFHVPGPSDTFILYDNVRATAYFAIQQWLPESAWTMDETRTAYEHYDGERVSVMIPVKEKQAVS